MFCLKGQRKSGSCLSLLQCVQKRGSCSFETKKNSAKRPLRLPSQYITVQHKMCPMDSLQCIQRTYSPHIVHILCKQTKIETDMESNCWRRPNDNTNPFYFHVYRTPFFKRSAQLTEFRGHSHSNIHSNTHTHIWCDVLNYVTNIRAIIGYFIH